MKKLFSILALMCLVTATFAQMVNPIKWSSDIKEDGNNVEITLKATIDAGWHLYGLELPSEDGPSATTITYPRLEGAELDGKITPASELIVKFDPMFGFELNWYEKEAVFTQRLKITDPDNWAVAGNITFMGCNDETCMMGEPFNFAYGPQSRHRPHNRPH